MVASVIPSLAIVKVNWDDRRDYIDNFVPFVAECIRVAAHAEISVSEVQAAVARSFGLTIPQGALQTILNRVRKQGYVERVEGVYRRNDEALARLEFAKVRDDALRKSEALSAKLIEFCGNRFRMEWSPQEAETALLTYLEKGSSAILAAALGDRIISPPKGRVAHVDLVVGSFVAEMHRADPEGFEYLETVVKGSMLAGALLFPNIGAIKRHFEGVEVYFDTPFVLQALGLEGESRQAPRLELINLLYEENANLRIFEHTLDELRKVLNAAARGLRNYTNLRYAHGATSQYLLEAGYAASDVELIIARLEKSLSSLHIRPKAKPPYSKALGVDERKLQSVLQEEVGYHREDTLFHDLDSLTAVHRLRRGRVHLHIEACDAVFVTTNHSLIRASTTFFREEYEDHEEGMVPHCLLDHVFTALVWLKKPLDAPDLPRKRILADCYAAMNPSDMLWRKYLDEIDRLEKQGNITEEDYFLLRFSTAARSSLMDATLGDTEALTEGTVADILERAQSAARAKTEAALSAATTEKEAAERRAAEAERKTAELAAAFEAQRQAQLDRVRVASAQAGRWAGVAAQWIGVVALGVVVYLALLLPSLPGGQWSPSTAAILVAFGAFTIANLAFGTTLRSFTRRLEVLVARFSESILLRLFQP